MKIPLICFLAQGTRIQLALKNCCACVFRNRSSIGDVNRARTYSKCTDIQYTVEPPNKGHFGNGFFVLSSEVVPSSEVHCILIIIIIISTMFKLLWMNFMLSVGGEIYSHVVFSVLHG